METQRKNKLKSVFVVLHYVNLNDTLECVTSLKSTLNPNSFRVVIVDNASPNNTGQELFKIFEHDEQVDVIQSPLNVGFAKGNNLGCMIAVKKYEPDFLIVINNDTLLKDKEFLERIDSFYSKNKFDILGPRIISLVDNKDQNPCKVIDTVSKINRKLFRYYLLLILNYLHLEGVLRSLFRTAKEVFNLNAKNLSPNNGKFKLHGSALVFSKDYYNKYEEVFIPVTFLYCEEDLLYWRTQKDQLIMLYYPGVHIFHKEDSSTEAIFGKGRLKRRFYYTQNIKSWALVKKAYEKQSS